LFREPLDVGGHLVASLAADDERHEQLADVGVHRDGVTVFSY